MSKKTSNIKVLDHFSIWRLEGGRNKSAEAAHCLKSQIHSISVERLNAKQALCTTFSVTIVQKESVNFIILSKSRKHGLDWLFFC